MLLAALMVKTSSVNAVVYPLVIGGFAIIASIVGHPPGRESEAGREERDAGAIQGLIVAARSRWFAFWPIPQWMMGDIVRTVPFDIGNKKV